MDHPYSKLNDEKFWRVAVSEKAPAAPFRKIWTPRFAINRKTKLISAGSCFAQHVGEWLRKNGYQWSPTQLVPDGGGFSFAFGNIYTPAGLMQWLRAALGETELDNTAYEENGVFHDLLRPAVFPAGLDGEVAFRSARQAATDEMLEQIRKSEIFIFTLGLTEAWLDDRGVVYPVCSGTIAGKYEPERHHFKNYDYAEILEDMLRVRDLIGRINPDMKIILTVSPVPLTATASDDHVLVATTYSKAVLRAVAGQLREIDGCFDYFPSFELINAPRERERFFADNLRSVTRDGVDFVLRHFRDALDGNPVTQIERARTDRFMASDVFCDEERLDPALRPGLEGAAPDVLLLGDSHMGYLSDALGSAGIATLGGRAMDGTAWVEKRFDLDASLYFIVRDDDGAARDWRRIMDAFKGRIRASDDCGKPVLFSNIGLHTHRSIDRCWNWIEANHDIKDAISQEHLDSFFETDFAPHLGLLEALSRDCRVIVIGDPPLQSLFELTRNHVYAFEWYEAGFEKAVTRRGCEFFSARRWLNASDDELEKYRLHIVDEVGNEDWFHGNDLYYRTLAGELSSRYLVTKNPN